MPTASGAVIYLPNTGGKWSDLQPPFTIEVFCKVLSTVDFGIQTARPIFCINHPGMPPSYKAALYYYFSVSPMGINIYGHVKYAGGTATSLSHLITGYSGKWTQFALRCDSNSDTAPVVSLVINGAEIATSSPTKSLLVSTPASSITGFINCSSIATIGGIGPTTGTGATIDDVFIYNSYLSVADLKEHWEMLGQPNWNT